MKRCVAWMNSSVILFGGLSAATAGLGIWQLKRYYWKIDLIKHNEELFHMPLETIVATDYRRWSSWRDSLISI